MDSVLALALSLIASGEPALAGGPDAPVQPGQVQSAAHRVEIERRLERCDRSCAAAPVRAGDPVSLHPDFFATPLTGGVERPAPTYALRHGGVIILVPHSQTAPLSAGQAAAARGLPRD